MVKSFKALAAIAVGTCAVTGLLAFTARSEAIAQDHTEQKLTTQDNAAHAKDIYWGYGGIEGPEFWGNLSQKYGTCATDTQQLTIDLEETVNAHLDEF